jgi:hypothetical protein
MITENVSSVRKKLKQIELTQRNIIIILVLGFFIIIATTFLVQVYVEKDAFTFPAMHSVDSTVQDTKAQYEIYKLRAEIRQIRSDTSGSLFWLKLIALFVTVGGAVGGYLYGQSKVAQKHIDFEKRKNIDLVYQEIVKDLSSKEDVLRATAAVKLGMILKNFPVEWDVSMARRNELVQITKQVLAASLSIETNEKVRKTITISLVQKSKELIDSGERVNMSGLDLSGANAADAYWADVDFADADFFKANLANTSFRRAVLKNAQFYDACLRKAILSKAECRGTNFKLADLRNADLSEAVFDEHTNFEGAKVFGIKLNKTDVDLIKDVQVDVSVEGDNSAITSFKAWLQET